MPESHICFETIREAMDHIRKHIAILEKEHQRLQRLYVKKGGRLSDVDEPATD